MFYEIITSDNWQRLEELRKAGEKRAKENYKTDRFNGYTNENFAILGIDAIKRFEKEYGFSFTNFEPEYKTDKKTTAEVIPYLIGNWYYDAREPDPHGGLADVWNHSTICNLIRFDGLLLTPGFHRKAGETQSFRIFNDSTDYNFLPYNWNNEHPEPQRVGVLSDKKLQAWVDWLNLRRTEAENIKSDSEDEVGKFLKKVRSIDTSKCSDVKIGEKRGHLVRNGIQFSYEISGQNTIHTKLEIDLGVKLNTSDKLDIWKKIVEGKY